MRHKSFGGAIAKWFDDWKLAGLGILNAMKGYRFWLYFLLFFVLFGTLLSFFSSGFAAFNYFFAVNLGEKISTIFDAFLSLFGVGRSFWDFLITFLIAILQGLLLSLIVLVYKHRRQKNKQKQKDKNDKTASGALQNAGISAGLAILGSGCPTCGATLITPILSAIFSTGGYAIAGTISGIITLIAIIIAIFSVQKLGVEMYVIMLEEKRSKRLKKEENGKNN